MQQCIFRVDHPDEYSSAGSRSIVELTGAAGNTNLYFYKSTIEVLVTAIAAHESVNLSGPTGSGKTALMEALSLVPANFLPVCEALGLPPKPIKCFPIEMAQFETPGELFRVRSLADGSTFYEDSTLVEAIASAQSYADTHYVVIWNRELGRCQTGIQSALVNLIAKGDIIAPDGRRFPSEGISFVCDNNYQALDTAAVHTLCPFDDALRRRYTVNLTLDYMSPSTEAIILRHLLAREDIVCSDEILSCIVKLGARVRESRIDGNLQTLPPPTIHGYLGALRLSRLLPAFELQDILEATMLGNASLEDRKQFPAIYHDVLGTAPADDDDNAAGGDLF